METDLETTDRLGAAVKLPEAFTARSFCETLLTAVNAWVRVDCCSLIRHTSGSGAQVVGAASVSRAGSAAGAHIDRRPQVDRPRGLLAPASGFAGPIILRSRPGQVAAGADRDESYEQRGIVDRLCFVARDGRGGLVAVDLCRERQSGEFSAQDLEILTAMAPLFKVAGTRHIELLLHAASDPGTWRPQLEEVCPAMTVRELDVAANLLAGRTLREAAATLGVAYSSVVRYCKRVYTRLGVSNLRELRARFASRDLPRMAAARIGA